MKREDAIAAGYTMNLCWCMRCHVGQATADACWLCGLTDKMHKWQWLSTQAFGIQAYPYQLVPLPLAAEGEDTLGEAGGEGDAALTLKEEH